jgi:hypothetical protein
MTGPQGSAPRQESDVLVEARCAAELKRSAKLYETQVSVPSG